MALPANRAGLARADDGRLLPCRDHSTLPVVAAPVAAWPVSMPTSVFTRKRLHPQVSRRGTMRAVLISLVFLLAGTAHADSVKGWCERDGKRLDFSDGIAFKDARDESGVVTTTIYLTAKPLDRSALAKSAQARGELGTNTFVSPRGDLIEAQHAAVDAGWIELAHVGGDLDMATIVNIMYLAADGSLTGLDGGNGRIELTAKGERFTGKLVTEARDAPLNETDMRCDLAFDLAVGWPG
ncbi:hypothetical protein [Dokdonella sp.]|uniref:hypothetical protein n=1 Tax=Dokdonella sp. TaxID=2291710 RepID=UPI0025BAF848|nr:hypothetical protein [Dokdonella sp.]MBX3689307.1 hypothetical protein [Dokdonella sp.]